MTLLEFLRNKVFWTLDSLKGSPIKHSLAQLEQIEMGGVSDNQVVTYQQAELAKLLDHCQRTVPAYKDICSMDLKDWPIVNKNVLRDNKDLHLSSVYNQDKLISMSTSGSTGTPFSCLQDINKKKHVNAEVLFYSGKTGYKVGQRIIFIRSLVKKVTKSPLEQFMSNIYLLNCKDFSDKGIEDMLHRIKELSAGSGAMILSYASTLDAFRKYFEKNGTDATKGCNIFGVVSGSEMLYDVTRDAMEKAFNCKCFSRYSNEENGLIGQDDKKNNVFLNNRASYIVEILKFGSNEPAPLGEVGRVVITDLFNYAMPMVRYDTGDAGSWVEVEYNGVKRKAIGNFAGRAVDMIFDCEGNQISPHMITNGMWKFEGVKQFQFIQKSPSDYLMKINQGSIYNSDELLKMLHDIIGKSANIKLEEVDNIPILASGKRRYIVNETL